MHPSRLPLLVGALLPAVACVSSGRYQAKETELAQLRRDADEQQRGAAAERRRLARELEAARIEMADLRRRLTEVTADRDAIRAARDSDLVLLAQFKKRLEALGQNVQALTHEKGALAASMADALGRLQELNRLKAAADERAATYRTLVQKLQGMISAGSLDVVVRRGRVLIVMPTDVLFDSGRTQIKTDARQTLAAVAGVLATVADRRFSVVGHTDDVPIHTTRFRSNWDLSTARAVEVALFLISAGIEAQRLGAAGHGEFDPVAPNNSDENRHRNRRVEIELEPNITELPSFPAG